MNTRLTIRRPGRAVAVVGAVVAVSATTLMALSATANAAGSGRCTQNVNVRAEPKPDARIVALCEAGKQVQVGETRNGFVQLKDLNGWASQEYVSVNGAAPVRSSHSPSSSSTNEPDADEPVRPGHRHHRHGSGAEPATDSSTTDSTDNGTASADSTDSATPGENTDPANEDAPDPDAAPAREAPRSPLAGLLGGGS
jgi:uncharacterized protein YraI